MMLVIIKGTNLGNVYNIGNSDRVIIGRGEESDIRVLDLKVSRRHCCIEKRYNNFYIRDLHSTNKTIVNRSIINEEIKLNPDDIIEIGDTALIFTEQKEVSVKSVEDFNIMMMNKTKEMDKK